MQDEFPQGPVALSFIDADFLVVELDLNRCSAEVKWLRQASGEEYRLGLELALGVACELKRELRRTLALVRA